MTWKYVTLKLDLGQILGSNDKTWKRSCISHLIPGNHPAGSTNSYSQQLVALPIKASQL